jgi:hypothetical protein
VCILVTGALGVGREFIALDHWAYRALDRFEALGLCDVPTDAPFTRTEFIALVSEIKERSFDRRLPARDRYELERLEKEFTEFESVRNPQARYDPPTFFLEERPVLFELDLDLVGDMREEFRSEFGTEYYLASSPEFRLHFSDHATYDGRYRLVMGPEHGDRARDQKPSRREKSFKGLTSLYERSYVILGWDRIHVFYGREYVDWGPSDGGNLITPGTNISLDQLGWRLKLKWFRLSMFNAQLSPVSQRHMAGHRLEMRFSRVNIGLSETVVYAGKEWDPIYAFPLSSFYANQFNERTNADNIYWSADLKYSLLDAVTLYGSLLIDDYQFERDGANPDKMAFDIGGRAALQFPVATTIRARYRLVDIHTYTHDDSLAVYVSGEGLLEEGDDLLGGQPGPDAVTWRIEADFFPMANLIATGLVFSERTGEGNDMRPYQPGDPIDPALPSGIVQRTIGWGLKARWELPRNSWVEGAFFRGKVSNIDHVSGESDTSNAFRLAVRVDF